MFKATTIRTKIISLDNRTTCYKKVYLNQLNRIPKRVGEFYSSLNANQCPTVFSRGTQRLFSVLYYYMRNFFNLIGFF